MSTSQTQYRLDEHTNNKVAVENNTFHYYKLIYCIFSGDVHTYLTISILRNMTCAHTLKEGCVLSLPYQHNQRNLRMFIKLFYCL
jgi:hypothetical protein